MAIFELWLGWLDSNQRMPIPKTGALPLGDIPKKCWSCAQPTTQIILNNAGKRYPEIYLTYRYVKILPFASLFL